jgi:hypothetical protein
VEATIAVIGNNPKMDEHQSIPTPNFQARDSEHNCRRRYIEENKEGKSTTGRCNTRTVGNLASALNNHKIATCLKTCRLDNFNRFGNAD